MVKEKVVSQAMIPLLLYMTIGLVSAGKGWANQQDHHIHDNFVDDAGPAKSHISRLDVVCSKDHMTVHMSFDTPFYGMVYSHAGPQHERCVHVGPRAGLTETTFHISKDHMIVHMSFDTPFYGMVYSHAGPQHERCVHVGPRAGVSETTFHIRYDGCGTSEDLRGQFHENTLVVQYGEDVLEAWDEAKRLRCEWLESFEKHSSKPVVAISDIDTVELNFQGDDIDCWMEVQEGKGPWSRQVGGIVPIGSPLTLVIAINDNSREFDMRVKKCSASDGSGHEVQLTDHNGCVIRTSLLTPFAKIRDFGGKATLVAYSHLFAFKFPDTLDVFVHCMVEVCRHGCPDACGVAGHHQNHREFTLESKKKQKLAEFTNLKHPIPLPNHPPIQINRQEPPKVLPIKVKAQEHPKAFPVKVKAPELPKHPPININVQAPLHRPKLQYLTQVPAHLLQQVKSRKDVNKDVLNSEEFIHSLFRNASTASSFIDKHLGNVKHESGLAGFYSDSYGEAGKAKHEIQKAATNIHIPPADIETHKILTEQQVNNGPRVISDVKAIPIGHYHRIIGHDAHWNSEEVKKQDEQYMRHHIPPLTAISYQPPQQATYIVKTPLKSDVVPQPEPAAWSLDNVKPLTKQEVLNPHIANHHKNHQIPNFSKAPEPKPEPSPWTFDEVNPLHRPNAEHRPHIERERLLEPKPEPNQWTLQDVKPLTKEDLKTHSLNYKLQTQSHASGVNIPLYKESVLPQVTNAPEPVYIPQYTPSPKNMSGMMMNMMMMMPTLLPNTYQTARWPQKSTARLIRPDRNNFPYPIPQFPHRNQMNLGVIADRRSDEVEEDLQYELDPKSHPNISRVELNNPLRSNATPVDNGFNSTKAKPNSQEVDRKSSPSDQPEDILTAYINSQSGDNIRSPITRFVPPSLDIDELNYQPENKDRSAHSPRALNHRRKRSSEPVFGVKQRFQAISFSDLAFELNSTSDRSGVYLGRREEIVYGICMSPASMSVGIGFILILTLCSLMASLLLYEHSCRLRNKTSHLSLLTRTFNGRLESLYRVSRQHPNSDR